MQFPHGMPGALRFRTLHPLIDGDGACTLVYDVERAAVFEVPEELRFHVAPALETGNLDEELLSWLASADLLTAESSADWQAGFADHAALGAAADSPAAAALDSGAGFPWAGLGADEAHGWIDQPEAGGALAAVDLVWKRAAGSSRIKLHLDWVGTFPPGDLLEKVVLHARRLAALDGREVSFELAIDPEQVTVEVGRRLAAHGVRVRLRCGECDPVVRLGTGQENRPWLLAEPAIARLLAPDRAPLLTVQCILDGPDRLIELWRWAKGIGVQSLDAIRLEHPGTGDGPGFGPPAARISEYRQDLYAIYEETCSELEAGRTPVEFQPLIRIVRRLMRNGALAAIAGGHGEPAAPGNGFRFASMESFDPRLLPELMWRRLDGSAEPEPPSSPCQSCWAHQVCSHSAYVASALGKEDPRGPSRERCGYWSAEVETAVRLDHRLDQIDAIRVLRFLEEAPGLRAPRPSGSLGDAPGSKAN